MEDKSWSEALYGPLPLVGDSLRTRFLRIHRGTGDDKLKCTLFTSTLIGPRYEALSYTWGTDAQTNPVTINGIVAGVTENLRDAMLALRRTNKSRVMWIDAVCINQNDNRERGHQVQQMGDIYQCAARVVVWLGPEADSSARLFNVMRLHSNGIAERLGPQRPKWMCNSVTCLLSRRYWTRVWIVQEMARAKSDPLILCGKEELSWSTLVNFLSTNRLSASQSHVQLLQGIRQRVQTPPRLRIVGNEVPTPSQIEASYIDDLLFLLSKTDKFDATDPRDKVFALFGMTRGSSEVATADYERSVARVFIDLAKTAISRTQCLDVTSHKSPRDVTAGLPTWVPNFALRRVPLIPKVHRYTAHNLDLQRRNGQAPIFSDDNKTLRIFGRLIGKVVAADIPKLKDTSQMWDDLSKILPHLYVLEMSKQHFRQRFLYWQETSQAGHRSTEIKHYSSRYSESWDDCAIAIYLMDIELHRSNHWQCHPSPTRTIYTEAFLLDDLIRPLDVRDFLGRVQAVITPVLRDDGTIETGEGTVFESWAAVFETDDFKLAESDTEVLLHLISTAVRAGQESSTLILDTYGRAGAMLSLISAAIKGSPDLEASLSRAYQIIDPGFPLTHAGLKQRVLTFNREDALLGTLKIVRQLQYCPELPSGPCPWPPGMPVMEEVLGRISRCFKSPTRISEFEPVCTSQGYRGFVASAVDVQPGDDIVGFNHTSTFKLLRRLAPSDDEIERSHLLGDVYLHSPDIAEHVYKPPAKETWHEYTIV